MNTKGKERSRILYFVISKKTTARRSFDDRTEISKNNERWAISMNRCYCLIIILFSSFFFNKSLSILKLSVFAISLLLDNVFKLCAVILFHVSSSLLLIAFVVNIHLPIKYMKIPSTVFAQVIFLKNRFTNTSTSRHMFISYVYLNACSFSKNIVAHYLFISRKMSKNIDLTGNWNIAFLLLCLLFRQPNNNN